MIGKAPRLFRRLVLSGPNVLDEYVFGAYFERSDTVVFENPAGTTCSYQQGNGPPKDVDWLETPADLLTVRHG